ncbi:MULTISPECIES: hypothetical protein [Burkholderia cepacia complex]|uniref:hypothetical protein n=1 Tax=Burkholderia cepacia complex TaxID=87882 RepID=UPI0007537008|nr:MULTISPECIES: hypothetical protein [Burkholderia cepacia complex]KVS34278.1 hypothetical protein WK36_12640 [Burkholderia cepacia]MBR8203368.1 hypothetical protein [Burkholderia vietnamiensis]MCA8119088.1 hypothetical protein [Burkholderia cepacia]
MTTEQMLREQWANVRDRLVSKHLLTSPTASLSLRIPGDRAMWFGRATDTKPIKVSGFGATDAECVSYARIHAAVYGARDDVGAVAVGGGAFGRLLADVGGTMPGIFDEQVRHLGRMSPAVQQVDDIGLALGAGGNTLLIGDEPICLGMTASRLVLNAELFEKCAKAFVLASATGRRVKALPWLVRVVANGRLMKDESRARARIGQGLLPEESKGY